MKKSKLINTVIIFSLIWLASCSKEKSTAPSPDDLTGDCRGCHTDDAKLKALAVADSSINTEPGEG